MKKLLLFSALGLCAFAAQAADTYTVYNNGVLGEDLTPYGWYNDTFSFDAADPTAADTKVLSFQASGAAGYTNASMGLCADDVTVTGPLSTATLHFSWYQVGDANYTIRLTYGSTDCNSNLNEISTSTTEKTWNEASINIAQAFPALAEAWKNAAEVNNFYVFSIVLEGGENGDVLYVNNIYYDGLDASYVQPAPPVVVEPTSVPTPEQNASDVLSLLSKAYDPATTFNFGQWGSTTVPSQVEIAESPVYVVKNFNYFGWELGNSINVADYNYLHVDYWTETGTTFGITPVTNGGSPTEKVWNASTVVKEEWNSYDIPLTYYEGLNLANVFQIKFDNGGGATGYIANVYFYKDENGGGNDQPSTGEGNGKSYSGTVKGTFTNAKLTGESEAADVAYKATYTATWNEDGTVTIVLSVDPVVVGLVPQLFINNAFAGNFENGEKYTITTTETFNQGEEPFNLYFAYDGGFDNEPLPYTVGAEGNDGSTAVKGLATDLNAPVEYYDLAGRKVLNPQGGIFVRRQGNNVSKVVIR